MEELWEGPRRDALKTPTSPPNHPRSTLACVFTRDGSCGMTSLARLDTMRRMHTTQRSGPQPGTRLCQPHRPLQSGHALHRHAPKSQRALAPKPWTAASACSNNTYM
jgi:hypothetical protein